MLFEDPQGRSVSLEDIAALIQTDYEYQVFVGTDSQIYRNTKSVTYATCIVLYKKGRGGTFFVSKSKKLVPKTLKDRLMKETWSSIEVSMQLSHFLPKNAEIIIHVDVNPSMKFASGQYKQELISMVTGQGYKIMIKPDAWCAQSVADRQSKK